jgi:transcriptional regulator with XRE-family HTH domain
MTFGEYIHKKRTEKKLTMTQLQNEYGINDTTLSDLENNLIIDPKFDFICAVCDALDLDIHEVSELYKRTNMQKPSE